MQPMVIQSILDLFQHFARVMRTKRVYSKQWIYGLLACLWYLKDQRVYKSLLDYYVLSVLPSPAMLVSDGKGLSDGILKFSKVVRPTGG